MAPHLGSLVDPAPLVTNSTTNRRQFDLPAYTPGAIALNSHAVI